MVVSHFARLCMVATAHLSICEAYQAAADNMRGTIRNQVEQARLSIYRRRFAQQLPVWVHAYARSGSSTVLSMVSQAFEEAHLEEKQELEVTLESLKTPATSLAVNTEGAAAEAQLGHVFSLFEPCHEGDQLEAELASQGCGGLIGELASCRFDKIKSLNGWRDSHSKTRGAKIYTPNAASAACSGADVVAFKTISQAGELFHIQEHGLPVLNKEPRLRMIDIVRDPRSIYASWMSTFPFNDTRLGGVRRDVSALKGLCESFASSLNVTHNQVHRVVFERLVVDPEGVMEDVYQFLQVPFGESQKNWVNRTFNAKECPGVDRFIAPYSDCHTNATESLEKWRTVLQPNERETFASYPPCLSVAHAYNYTVM